MKALPRDQCGRSYGARWASRRDGAFVTSAVRSLRSCCSALYRVVRSLGQRVTSWVLFLWPDCQRSGVS
jgi:hypothetical protein